MAHARAAHSVRSLRIALAQINVTVGDLAGNAARILQAAHAAADAGASLVCMPELALPGYPPEDLLLQPTFIDDNLRALDALAAATSEVPGLTLITGFVDRAGDLYNAAAVLRNGALVGVYHKHHLPTYGVFDEDRYFRAGSTNPLFLIDGVPVGISICEDIWLPGGPPTAQAYAGAELLLNISASPYHRGKQAGRERMLATRAADVGAVVAYTNLVGGQDELLFDGGSLVFDGAGELLARATLFAEDLLVVDVDVAQVFNTRLHDPRRRRERGTPAVEPTAPIVVSTAPASAIMAAQARPIAPRVEQAPAPLEEAYQALVLGIRDYVRKTGFRDVVIGLSGGIDSALTAALAVDALGAEHVLGVSMPSRYSSEGSRDDARTLAERLGIRLLTLPIEPLFSAALEVLEPAFATLAPTDSTLAEENVQARLRGLLLMALSNRSGALVLTTGNKSEMATGYATLYGDMAGGFAVLKDVLKTLVFQLARWRNEQAGHDLIPRETLEKPPSAELRPGQIDSDSLPPYEVLDPILQAYVERDMGFDAIVAAGHPPEVVARVLALVDRSEYKRRQAPPGVKITTRAFGRDRRLPISNAYRGHQPTRADRANHAPARAPETSATMPIEA